MIGALDGIKVLDLSRYAPGPYCTMILGDLGADVIKVEEVGALTGRRAKQGNKVGAVGPVVREFAPPDSAYDPLNRNKRSIGLNLKRVKGRRIFYQMAEKADVVVEGFRPGVAERLEKVRQVGIALKLSETPGSIRKFSPGLGEDTEAILFELGYGKGEIDKLRKESYPPA